MKEPYETTFRGAAALMVDSLQGTSGKGQAKADYGRYCREHKEEVVRFMNDYLGRRTNGVRAVRALEVPARHDGADLYLEIYTEGVPADSVRYTIVCGVGVCGNIEVKLVA